MWWITNTKGGMSALSLQRILGLGSYETAWTCLHKLRRAMVRPDRDRLKGRTEVDETFVGGLDPDGRGRHLGKTKALVAVAAEAKGERGIGRIRLHRVADSSGKSLLGFVQKVVKPRTVVITDGWAPYAKLSAIGYIHHPKVARPTGKKSSITLLPRVHRVAALLKRWLLGIHHGAVSKEHLDDYLDEFTFRFNRRKSRNRGKLFFRLMQQAVLTDPVPYGRLVKTNSVKVKTY